MLKTNVNIDEGPLMLYNVEKNIYIQLGIVAGGINFDQCGVDNYPTVFSRLNHPEVLSFVKSIAEQAGECLQLMQFPPLIAIILG
jgi:hypothetical protein